MTTSDAGEVALEVRDAALPAGAPRAPAPASLAVTVLAPAYNEEAVIERFVRAVVDRLGDDAELVVVDDGSVDGTGNILDGLSAQLPRLRVVTHRENLGMGAALATGFRAADGRVIVTLDADLSHPLDLVDELVRRTEEADAVFASRFVPGGGMDGVPRLRSAVSHVGNRLLRVLFRSPVRDLTTGMRAYRVDAVQPLQLAGRGFETQLEITVRLLAAGRLIDEVPLRLGTRAAGRSKMNYVGLVRPYGRALRQLLPLRWGRRS
jgi:dolichol-phosphate mannosyltransferase